MARNLKPLSESALNTSSVNSQKHVRVLIRIGALMKNNVVIVSSEGNVKSLMKPGC